MNADQTNSTPESEERAPRPRVGRLMRRQREEYNQDLRSVADATRIRYAYLQAIEEGRFGDLPGLTYAVGFVRTYADYLGLDEEEIVARFKEEVEGLDRRTNLEFPVPVSEGKVPSGAIIALAVMLVAVAYGGWYYLSERGQSLSDLVPEVPERLQNLLDGEDTSDADGMAGAGPEGVEDPDATGDSMTGSAGDSAGDSGGYASDYSTDYTTEGSAEGSQPEATAGGSSGDEGFATQTASDRDSASQSVPDSDTMRDSGEADAVAAANDAGASPEAGSQETSGFDAVQDNAESLAAAEDIATDAAPEDATPEVATPEDTGPETAAVDTGADDSAESDAAIPEAPDSTQSAEVSTDDTDGRLFGAANTDARIVLRATDDSWVQVRDADGQLLLTRVMRAGDLYRVPNDEGLTLLTGNAGGLDILVDGETAPSLGQSGDVVRDVALDPQRLLDGTAARQ